MKELLAVLRNRNLMLLSSARIVSAGGDYVYRIALSVAVYHYSGGKTVDIGILWIAMLVPTLALGSFGGGLAGRLGYRRTMILADVVRTVIVLALALVLTPDTWVAVYPLVFLVSIFTTLFKPASVGLIPMLVHSKDERLAANSVVLQAESVALIVGSALGGLAAGAGLTKPLLVIDAATFAVSALSLWFMRPQPRVARAAVHAAGEDEAVDEGGGLLSGFRLVMRRPLLVFSGSVMAFPEFVSGSIVVWFVPFSLLLHLGNGGVGYMYAAYGVGAVLGGVAAATIGGNLRLDYLLAGAVALGGLSLALYGSSRVGLVALAFLIVLGVAETTEYAAYGTLVQQAVPEHLIGSASGTMDSFLFGMMLLGSILSGILADWLGLSVSIVGLGSLTVLATVAALLNLRRETAGQPDAADLAKIPVFAPVPAEVREWAVRRMLRERYRPGAVIIRQGDEGEKFYTIAKGTAQVQVAAEGQSLTKDLGPGDFFGEIALLKNVPRTATVRAIRPLTLYALTRDDFQELQRRAADFRESLLDTATARLDEDTRFQATLGAMRS